MWSEHLWISFSLIAVIVNRSSTQVQLENTDEYQENDPVQNDLGNMSIYLDYGSVMNSSNILFEDMLANSMKNFLPFSYENENCTRDGLQYVTGLQDQSGWAIRSK